LGHEAITLLLKILGFYDIHIDTINTYSAFIVIGIKLLAENGILTAIVPRGFCNGLYLLPFRRLVYNNTAIKLDEYEKEKICFMRRYYVLLKRFTSKEEKHRIQATLLTPDDLNIIHNDKSGLEKEFAY